MVLRRLRFRVNGCRAQKIVQNLGLHSLNFQAVAAGRSLKFPRAGGLAHLRQPGIEPFHPFLRGPKLFFAFDHNALDTTGPQHPGLKDDARGQRSFVGHAEVASGSQSFAGSWVKRLSTLCLEPLDQLQPGHCRLPARQFGRPWELQGSLSFADSYGYSVHNGS